MPSQRGSKPFPEARSRVGIAERAEGRRRTASMTRVTGDSPAITTHLPESLHPTFQVDMEHRAFTKRQTSANAHDHVSP